MQVKYINQLEMLLCEVFRLKPDDLKDELAMEDVSNWDSLTHMDLIASLEETFSIQLSMDEIMEMRDIKAIKRIIGEKVV